MFEEISLSHGCHRPPRTGAQHITHHGAHDRTVHGRAAVMTV
jgi:hypothetical protein